MKRVLFFAAFFLILIIFCAGCLSTNTPIPGNTTEVVSSETTQAPPQHFNTTPTATQVSASTSFPDAVPPGTYVTWQNGDIPLKATMTHAVLVNNYTWFSDSWGTWYPVEAASGKKYLCVFVRYVNTGKEISRIPSVGMVDLVSDGTTFRYASKRTLVRSDQSSKGESDTQIRVNGKDIFDEDYADTNGDITISVGDSNAYEGFLIYVVPDTIDLNETYFKIRLSSSTTGIWSMN